MISEGNTPTLRDDKTWLVSPKQQNIKNMLYNI